MSKSKWKIFSCSKQLLVLAALNQKTKEQITVVARNLCILKNFVGQKFAVYNGRMFVFVQVNCEMVGYKFGDFAITTVQARYLDKREKRK